MRSAALQKLIIPAIAALAYSWVVLPALPQYPEKVSWEPWVNPAALGVAFFAFVLWFAAASWAVALASSVRSLGTRAIFYAALLFTTGFAALATLLPAFGILGACRIGLKCGANAQGLFSVLSAMSRQGSIVVALPLSLLFVGVVILISSRSRARASNA